MLTIFYCPSQLDSKSESHQYGNEIEILLNNDCAKYKPVKIINAIFFKENILQMARDRMFFRYPVK